MTMHTTTCTTTVGVIASSLTEHARGIPPVPDVMNNCVVSRKAALAVAVTKAGQRVRTTNGLVPVIGIEGGAKFNSASIAMNTGV